MKLLKEQQKLYDGFYDSTHNDGVLDTCTELLVGLSAAMASNCEPCTAYYLQKCQKEDIPEQKIQAVLGKVMAVAAGQKRLQTERVLQNYRIKFKTMGAE